MLLATIALPLAIASAPALAAWGPVAGYSQFKVEDRSLSKLSGYEAGVLVQADDQSTMWRVTYGLLKSGKDLASLELYQAELSFRMSGSRYLVPYAGIGGALAWLGRGEERRRAWIGQAHSGILLAPLESAGELASALPCLSCIRNSSSPDCRRCMMERRSGQDRRPLTMPEQPSWLYLGAEIGYRTAKMMLSGWEGRAYLAILF